MSNNQTPICISEKQWANGYLSIAKYHGGIKAFGHEYRIVNNRGVTLYELSDPHSKFYVGDGDRKAIEPGESADLCRTDFIPFYKKLGRETFVKVLKEHPHASDTELKKIYKELTGRLSKKTKELTERLQCKLDFNE